MSQIKENICTEILVSVWLKVDWGERNSADCV